MGFLDDVVGKVNQAVGESGGERSALVNEVLGFLGGSAGGGLQGMIQSFKDKGLGDLMSSWISTGQNLPINTEQLRSGLGSDIIGQLAARVGIPAEAAASSLTQILPTLIDKLTPEGKIPESGLLEQGMNFLRSNLSKG